MQTSHPLEGSFRCLNLGIWPTHAPNDEPWPEGDTSMEASRAGEPLTEEGYCCAFWAHTGDLDWNFKEYDLENPGSSSPCTWCPCDDSRSPNGWSTFGQLVEIDAPQHHWS